MLAFSTVGFVLGTRVLRNETERFREIIDEMPSKRNLSLCNI